MSNRLPLLSLRRAAEEENPFVPRPMPGMEAPQLPPIGNTQIESFPHPSMKPGAWVGPAPLQTRVGEQYAREVPTQMPGPSIGRQILEGLAGAVAGTSLQPGPGATFRTAGLTILGLLAGQALAAPILRGAREREGFNQRSRQRADAREAGRMERENVAAQQQGAQRGAAQLEGLRQTGDVAAAGVSQRNLLARDTAQEAADKRKEERAFYRSTRLVTKADALKFPALAGDVDTRVPWDYYKSVTAPQTKNANRPSTGLEKKSLGFYNSGREAIDTITSKPNNGQSLEDRIGLSGMATGATKLPNWMQSGEVQRYVQAQRTFTEARLRQVSGSAINASEYENDAKMYFAQPGDVPETIAQKQRLREKVLDGLKFQAGPAYFEYYGGETASPGGGFAAPVQEGIPDDEAYQIWLETTGGQQ